jgi:hypothetical protein
MTKKSTPKHTRDEILTTLGGESIAFVKFVKSNGEVRRMKCTRNPKHIPETFAPKTETDTKPVKENLDTINVYDLEKNGWRSFRVDSVIEYGVES